MSILFVSHKYPPSTGGMEKQSFELITGMARLQPTYSIILAEGQNRLTFFWTLERRINAMLAAHPDITCVHFNDALIGAVALRHKSYLHIKRCVTVHGLDVVFPNGIYQKRIFPKFSQFDLLIAVSTATALECTKRGIPAEKVCVIPNGVSQEIADMKIVHTKIVLAERYGFDAQRPYIVALGRAVRRKGFSWFATEVMPLLPAGTQFVMIGPFAAKPTNFERFLGILPRFLSNQIELVLGFPTDQAPLRRILSTQTNVLHLGRLPFDELVAMLHHAHAFVMPNIHVEGDLEGFGLVCLEAALAGAPVFAAATDGIVDAIHHEKNGIHVASGDPHAWASALTDCITQPAVYKAKAAQWRDFTKQEFQWERMVKRYWDVCR
jgi:glycosyltransferase involved in cell wall biosynthesis